MVKAKKDKTISLGIVTNSHFLGQEIPRIRSKVAIVGFAPSTMTDVRNVWDDPDFEIWSINQLYMAFPDIVPKTTRWFQFHHRSSYDQAIRDHKHHDWLAAQTNFPIYMQRKELDIPNSIPFPKNEIINWLSDKGFQGSRYFTNSISWEIALAIMEGFKVIHIYGVDMAQADEYQEQRPSCEYFIGLAEGMGIKVYVPPKSDLLKTIYLYPFEDEGPIKTKITSRRQELRQRIDQLFMQEQQIRDERMHLIGANENMNYIERAWLVSRNELLAKSLQYQNAENKT